MKKILAIILFISCSLSSAWVQASGIEFVNSSWQEALAKAAEENKLIFLDAYTTWCGPCKKMTREIFPKAEAGEFFNTHFVNVKMDMEKGEGLLLAEKYNIAVYPTLLFVDSEGNLLHRAAGYHDLNQFLALGKTAKDPRKRLGTLEKKFAEGNRNADFLFKYTMARAEIQDGSHLPVLEEYLKTQKDWNTPENLDLIYNLTTDANSVLFDHITANKKLYIERFGQREVLARIQDLIYQAIGDTKDESSLVQIDKLYAKAYPDKAERMSANFRMSFYRQLGDRENYAKSAVDYFNSFPEAGPDELNDVAWTFYQVIEDKKLLKYAKKWAKRSVKLDPQYHNHDTLAAIYQKMGKTKKAIKIAEGAIAIAKNTGEDYSNTSMMLEELRAK